MIGEDNAAVRVLQALKGQFYGLELCSVDLEFRHEGIGVLDVGSQGPEAAEDLDGG